MCACASRYLNSGALFQKPGPVDFAGSHPLATRPRSATSDRAVALCGCRTSATGSCFSVFRLSARLLLVSRLRKVRPKPAWSTKARMAPRGGASGCERIFDDKASGARDDRPGLAAALSHLRQGDTLVCYKLDRLGRGLRSLIDFFGEHSRSVTRGNCSTTPTLQPRIAPSLKVNRATIIMHSVSAQRVDSARSDICDDCGRRRADPRCPRARVGGGGAGQARGFGLSLWRASGRHPRCGSALSAMRREV